MIELLEKLIIKHHKRQYAMQIVMCSPMSAVHVDSFSHVEEEAKKYGLSYLIASDDFLYIQKAEDKLNVDAIIEDKDEILFEWLTPEDTEEFFTVLTNYLLVS
jgi:kynurenine formamidase